MLFSLATVYDTDGIKFAVAVFDMDNSLGIYYSSLVNDRFLSLENSCETINYQLSNLIM